MQRLFRAPLRLQKRMTIPLLLALFSLSSIVLAVCGGSSSASGSSSQITLTVLESVGWVHQPEMDLAKQFEATDYMAWRSFRDSEDARFVSLVMPRVLARLPYGANTKPIEEFNFEETELDSQGRAKPVANEHYSWMNAAYVMGTKLTDAFAKDGFCVAIRGAEGGGNRRMQFSTEFEWVSPDGRGLLTAYMAHHYGAGWRLHTLPDLQAAEAFTGHAVVLVEGISDQLALEALARRRGRDLHQEGVSILPVGGSKNFGSFLDRFGPQGSDVRLAGLCDAPEEGDFRRGLGRAGLGSNLNRGDDDVFALILGQKDDLCLGVLLNRPNHGGALVAKTKLQDHDIRLQCRY